MARARNTTKTAPAAPPPVEFQPAAGDSEPQDAIAAINALAASGTDQDWLVSVHQLLGAANQGAKKPWLFDVEVDELRDLRNRLAEIFPQGGRFQVICRLNNVIYRSFVIEIARRVGYSSLPPAGDRYAAPQAPVSQNAAPDIFELMREMQRQNQEFMREVINAVRQQAPAPARTFADSLAEFKAFNDLMPQPAAAPPNIGLDLFEKGLKFGERLADMGGGDGGGGGKETLTQMLVGIAREVLQPDTVKVIASALVERTPAPPAAVHQLAQNPRDPVRENAAQPKPQQQPQNVPPAINLDQLVELLIERAAQGQDPEIAADFVIDIAPDALLDQLDALPDPVALLNARYPMTVQYKDWFVAVLEKMAGDDISEPEGSDQGEHDGPEDSDSNGS